MNSIQFEDPSSNDNEESIMWHNMKVCDDIHNLQLFISCSMAWLRLNPEKNMQDLESELRKRNFNTHLYAKNAKNVLENSQYEIRLNSKNCDYECIFSCRPAKLALEEVLKFHETYESNFEKLANSGFLCLKSEKDISQENEKSNLTKNQSIKIFDDKDKSIAQLLLKCEQKITIVTIPAEKYIQDICLKCKEIYGEEPEHKIVGISYEGGPIIGLFLGEQLVNEYGYVIECSKDREVVAKHMRLQRLC